MAASPLPSRGLKRGQKCYVTPEFLGVPNKGDSGARREQIWVDSACLEMEEKVYFKLWVQPGCSPRYTQIVPKWHLAGQLAGTDFFNTRSRRDAHKHFCFWQEQIWVDSACLEMEEKVDMKL